MTIQQAPAPDDMPAPASTAVLIVDDNIRVLTAVAHLVEAMGFPVMVASSGGEAIALYAKAREKIACVLLDLTMPGMDGIETFAELSRIDPQVSVVLSSGYGEHAVRSRFAGPKPAAFLQKPYLEDDLRQALDVACKQRAATRRGQAPSGPKP